MLLKSVRLRNIIQSLVISVVISQLFASYPLPLMQKVLGNSSPSFVRQEIVYNPGDWVLWKGDSSNKSPVYTHNGYAVQIPNAKDISQCKLNNKFVTPGIDSISYISNGRLLNATVWLASPFITPPTNDTLDVYQKQLDIKISNLSSSHYTLQNYTDRRKAELVNPLETKIDDNRSSTLAGNRAYKIVYNTTKPGEVPLKKMELWTIKNNKIYDVTYSALPSRYSDYLSIIQKMIDSFRIGSVMHIISNRQDNNSNQHRLDDLLTYQGYGVKIDYPVDWQKEASVESNNGGSANDKTTTITFRSPFEDQSSALQPSYHEITLTMAIDVASSTNDQGTGYRVIYSRIPYNTWTGNWTEQIVEVSAHDKTRVLEEHFPYTRFYDKNGQSYIQFYFDLDKINSPQQYKVLFYITDYFVLHHVFCRLIDTTNWIIIPPPEFTLSTTPNSVVLRPGEETDVGVVIKGNTNLPSQAFLNTTNNNDRSIGLNFIPNKTSIPPLSAGTSTLHIKALRTANATSYTLPISANISFPTTIKNKFGENFSNSKSESLQELSNLTLTVQPPYTMQEQLNNFVTSWITPINGLWSFLAGIAAVITPLIIRRKQKSKVKKENQD